MRHSEALIQVEIVKWLQTNGFFFFSVPNEGHAGNFVRASQLISMGLRPGVSDLIVVLPKGKILFLEVKDEDGKQSKAQILFEKRVKELGHEYFLVRSIESLKNYFKIY